MQEVKMANERISNLTNRQVKQIKDLLKEELSKYKTIPFHTKGNVLSALNRAFTKAQLINNGLSSSEKDKRIKKILLLREDKNLSWRTIANHLGMTHTAIQKIYNEYKQTVERRDCDYN